MQPWWVLFLSMVYFDSLLFWVTSSNIVNGFVVIGLYVVQSLVRTDVKIMSFGYVYLIL